MSPASSPNDPRDQTGMINELTCLWILAEQKRKEFKAWSRYAYKLTKYGLLILLCLGFFLI